MKLFYQVGLLFAILLLLSACSSTTNSPEEVFENFFEGINVGDADGLEDLTFYIEIIDDDNVSEEFRSEAEESAEFYTELYEVSSADPDEITIDVLSTEIIETDESTYNYYIEELNEEGLVEEKINNVETVTGSTRFVPRDREDGMTMDWEFTMVQYGNSWYMAEFIQDMESIRED